MALLAVEGIYKDGKVELTEIPFDVREARVMVVFLPVKDGVAAGGGDASLQKARSAAGERLLARMKKGYPLGGSRPYEKREELYDRLPRYG
jgi:hypothetical protein